MSNNPPLYNALDVNLALGPGVPLYNAINVDLTLGLIGVYYAAPLDWLPISAQVRRLFHCHSNRLSCPAGGSA